MLCSLLKVFKLYFITTSLFTSNSSVYTDANHKPVAITHEVSHPNLHTHYEFVILRNPHYRDCFLDHEGVILSTPSVGLELWKDHMRPTPVVAKGTRVPPPITIKDAPRSSIRPLDLRRGQDGDSVPIRPIIPVSRVSNIGTRPPLDRAGQDGGSTPIRPPTPKHEEED